MHELFTKLLISSPNGGGLFLVNDNQFFKLDSFDTTGISWIPELFLRGQQPSSIWICGDRTVDICNESVPFDDIHDVLCFGNDIYLVSTTKNEIVKLDRDGSEVQRWVFPGEDDSRHVNCLGVWNNRIVFSAFGDFRETRAYKSRTLGTGYVQDLVSGERLIVGLSQPHSLVSVGQNLLVANSEEMEIREYALSGDLIRAKKLGGYTRGICVSGSVVYVGLSRSRNIEDRGVDTATLLALDLESWEEVGRIPLPVNEIYSVLLIDDAHELVSAIAKVVSQSSLMRDGQIAVLNQIVSERDGQVAGLTQAVGERDERLAELDKIVIELEDGIAAVLRAMSDNEEEIQNLTNLKRGLAGRDDPYVGLVQAVIERNHQLAGLRESARERDERASALAHQLAERDGEVESLSRTVIEQEEQIAAFTQVLAERDGQITSGQIARLNEALNEAAKERDVAYATIEALRRSRSFRITAPLRRVTEWLRRISEPKPRCSGFSRVIMAACTLPASFFHYSGLLDGGRAIGRGKSFFGAVLNRPGQSRERLAKMPWPVRALVSASLSVALRIRNNGGVLPSLRNMYRIARQEGRRGVLARLMEGVPFDTAAVNTPPDRARILVMDYRIPMPDVSAGERATVGILRDLCAVGFDVVFLPNNMASAPGYEENLKRSGVTVVTSELGYHSSSHYLSKHGSAFGAFYLIRVDVAEAVLDTIRRVAPQANIIFHAPDVYFLRESREAQLKSDPTLRALAEATRERELAVMRQVNRTIIVSPAELPVLREFLPDAPISVFPVLYAPVNPNPAPFQARKNIFFLGGFAHTPNVDAVCWFVAEIWPLVREQLPDAVFHIIGSEAPQAVQNLASVPGVTVDGFLKDLDPLLSSMRVGVAPLRYGAGIKGKVAMTMGAGIPCVCTSIAAEGMGVEHGVHAYVTDDPYAFAQSVVRLYTDQEQWKRLSRNGRELVRRHFGEEANRASLLRILNEAKALPLQLYMDYCKAVSPRHVPCSGKDEIVDVSVIIPVYNQWDYTRACLNSVLETCQGGDIRYEIILADDGSTDETTHATKHFLGLRVVKTPRNVGFLRNCNNAAKHARGKYLLLLNNDTVVLPGWMFSLYRLIEEDASAAVVGSKLLYPDGTIQEAGGLLFGDGTGYNVGRGCHRDAPVFNVIRETDYVSGASIIIRKSFWNDVGGFDEQYKNAYCEDSDLAMTARSKGLRVLYQPASEVIHFEHQSYAEQAPSHDTTLQRHNINILIEKWHATFKQSHLVSVSWYMAMSNAERSAPAAALARRRQGRLNVLYFSPFPSHPSSHGNRATIQQFARRFQSMGHKVHFALLQSRDYSDDDLKAMRACWDTLDIISYTNPMLADGNTIPFDGWYEEGLGEQIRCLCAKHDIDVVFCSYVFQSKLLEYVPAYMLKVIDTHDKMGDRYEMLRANAKPLEFFSCTPEEEGAYLRRADIVVARREEEARYFDTVTGLSTAIVIPHVEDPHFVEKAFSGLHNVGIVASANRINLAIVRECLEAIDRRLRGETCPFTVHIAGQVKDMVADLPSREADIFRKPWVRMHGFVPDIARFYADMDVIVSPVTMGTGINVKTVQAMAFGMPLLTTICGSKGIETGDPVHSHANLDALVGSLLSLTNRPDELQRLAAISRVRYTTFYESSLAAMQQMFMHPKVTEGEQKYCLGALEIPKASATEDDTNRRCDVTAC